MYAFNQDPAYREKLEAIDSQLNAEEQANPAIQAAQRALNVAQGKQEQEQHTRAHLPEDYRWLMWTPAQRADVQAQMSERVQAARQAVSEAEQALRQARNEAAGKRYATQLQAKQAAEQKERDEIQVKHAGIEEETAREQYRGAFLTHGGTDAQFKEAWPRLWQAELERRVQAEQAAADRRDSTARGAF